MLFNSLDFLLIFLPAALLGYHSIKNIKLKLAWITILSLVFYAYWNWKFVGLIIISVIIDFICGKRITDFRLSDRRKAKKWMIVSIVTNLVILGFFKYCDFFIGSANFFLDSTEKFQLLNIILPVGISFYTFQSMSYSIDLYRGDAKPARSFLNFSQLMILRHPLPKHPLG